MALTVTQNYGMQGSGGNINLQGSAPALQGSSPNLQGSSPKLQATYNPQAVATFNNSPVTNAATKQLLANGQNLLQQYSTPEVLAPIPNYKAINASATARATKAVNPIYTKYLNDFLGVQAQQQATQTAIKDTAIQNAQDVLKQTQQANTVTGQRTTQDTATKEAQAAQTADWRQTDQGGQYDVDRVAQAINQAKSGLTGSGVAGGQNAASQEKFNTTESRQATQDIQDKQATELAKARTFEDLATSNINAVSGEAKAEKAAKFDLSTFLQQQKVDLQNKQQQLESARQNQISQTQAQLVKSGYQDFFNKISNPAQKAAFAKAYGQYL